jgi:hypothetical protein
MTTQSRQQARVDFELEMAEYYEAAGLDRLAERSRDIAAEIAAETEAEREAEAGLGHEYDGPELRAGTPEYEAQYAEYQAWAAQPEPEPEAGL